MTQVCFLVTALPEFHSGSWLPGSSTPLLLQHLPVAPGGVELRSRQVRE
ncbi:hypothetical protein [Rufibacter sp. XAAS-G3-1]|nr:hypothetical protein [Rufibacter sp. XAAS-G3-1]